MRAASTIGQMTVLASALALVLSACGSGESVPDGPGEPQPATEAPATPSADDSVVPRSAPASVEQVPPQSEVVFESVERRVELVPAEGRAVVTGRVGSAEPATTVDRPAFQADTEVGEAAEETPLPGDWERVEGFAGLWPAYSEELDLYAAVFAFVVRTSHDGITWTDPGRDPQLAEDAAWFDAVIAAGPGFVAYGRTCEGGGDFTEIEPFPCPQEPGIWVSSDGAAWDMVSRTDQFHVCSEFACHASVDWVGEGPDGLLASGYDAEGSALWASEDGSEWTRLTMPGTPCAMGCTSFASFNDRIYAFQYVENYDDNCCIIGVDTFAYESPDGRSWEPLGDRQPLLPGTRVMDAVVGHNQMLVVGEQRDSLVAWLFDEDLERAPHDFGSSAGPRVVALSTTDGFYVFSDRIWHLGSDGAWDAFELPRLEPPEVMGYRPLYAFVAGRDGEILTIGYIWRPQTDPDATTHVAAMDEDSESDECGP